MLTLWRKFYSRIVQLFGWIKSKHKAIGISSNTRAEDIARPIIPGIGQKGRARRQSKPRGFDFRDQGCFFYAMKPTHFR